MSICFIFIFIFKMSLLEMTHKKGLKCLKLNFYVILFLFLVLGIRMLHLEYSGDPKSGRVRISNGRPCPVFKWRPDFDWDSKSRRFCPVFEWSNIRFSNSRTVFEWSTIRKPVTKTSGFRMFPVFEGSDFGSLLYITFILEEGEYRP